jgi:hypothetical protein
MAHKARTAEHHHAARDRGRRSDGYQLRGGIPWPTLGDGTEWRDAVVRVRHKHVPDWRGRIQWVEWRNPDGTHMAQRSGSPTKTHPEGKPKEGAWFAVVSWDNADDPGRPSARQALAVLVADTDG